MSIRPFSPRHTANAGTTQKGAALIAILGALVVIGLLAALAMSGGGNNTSMGDSTNRARAVGVLQGLEQITTGYGRAALVGVTGAQVTLDSNATTGLFTPNIGGQLVPTWMTGTFPVGAPAPTLVRANFVLPGVGAEAGSDRVVVVQNVAEAVCRQVNELQGGWGPTPVTIPTLTTGGATLAANENVAAAQFAAWPTQNGAVPTVGCFMLSGSTNYVAYTVVDAI